MKIIAKAGRDDIAQVYICEIGRGKLVECVEALQPPRSRSEKWVLLISVMCGCPIGCAMCDAGGAYHGKLTEEEIFEQIEFLVRRHHPNLQVPSHQFKVQLSRMGEPSLNQAVIEVLGKLRSRLDAPGLMPSLSTIAPAGAEKFFVRLLEVKHERYAGGAFQLQFSLHTTNLELRDKIIPGKKWNFAEIAAYGNRFYAAGDRKITLNFALSDMAAIDTAVLLDHFSPEKYLIKITPINPTHRASANRLSSYLDTGLPDKGATLSDPMIKAGYEVIVSIGNMEENFIGSNCGQFLHAHLSANRTIKEGYSYPVHKTEPEFLPR
ncbi:MAG: radical protein [Deltaproteobacteria bacterium]|nr:radical protein [Deltaproteobacteria bacterium]